MAQKAATFFVPIENQENKDADDSPQEFNQRVQQIVQKLKPKLLSFPSICGISTKSWKSQNTLIIIAHLDRKIDYLDTKYIWNKCPEYLNVLPDDHNMMVNKPKSMISMYNVLDDKQNTIKIKGKEIILCVQQTQSKNNNILSLKTPTNIINPTKNHNYE
eukprot:751027_1